MEATDKYLVIVATMTAMPMGATALATTDRPFEVKKKYEKNQAPSYRQMLVVMVIYRWMSCVPIQYPGSKEMKMPFQWPRHKRAETPTR